MTPTVPELRPYGEAPICTPHCCGVGAEDSAPDELVGALVGAPDPAKGLDVVGLLVIGTPPSVQGGPPHQS